jgi:heme exporter protein D
MHPAHDYAAYIWPAYGLSGGMFLLMSIAAIVHARHWKRRAEALARPAGGDHE